VTGACRVKLVDNIDHKGDLAATAVTFANMEQPFMIYAGIEQSQMPLTACLSEIDGGALRN
jgi:hypothetical protein